MGYYWYLNKMPGGGWRDIRYRYARSDTVVCQKSYDYPDVVEPGYQVTLEDGKWVTLRWDQVV